VNNSVCRRRSHAIFYEIADRFAEIDAFPKAGLTAGPWASAESQHGCVCSSSRRVDAEKLHVFLAALLESRMLQ
jgi:hypothetical protein